MNSPPSHMWIKNFEGEVTRFSRAPCDFAVRHSALAAVHPTSKLLRTSSIHPQTSQFVSRYRITTVKIPLRFVSRSSIHPHEFLMDKLKQATVLYRIATYLETLRADQEPDPTYLVPVWSHPIMSFSQHHDQAVSRVLENNPLEFPLQDLACLFIHDVNPFPRDLSGRSIVDTMTRWYNPVVSNWLFGDLLFPRAMRVLAGRIRYLLHHGVPDEFHATYRDATPVRPEIQLPESIPANIEHRRFSPSLKVRLDLVRLISHLEQLPSGYRDFSMHSYHELPDVNDRGLVSKRLAHAGCGTVACAVGHAPDAGINCDQHRHWWDLDRYLACGDSLASEWMFGGQWVDLDNTPHGAAGRIRYALLHGLPCDPELVLGTSLPEFHQDYDWLAIYRDLVPQ